MRAPGYTLVELVLAAAILAVLAVAARSLVSPVKEANLDAAAREVVNALNFARGEAMRTGSFHGVDFSVDSATGERRIRVFRTDSGAPPNPVYDVRHPLDKKLYDLQLSSGTATAGVTVSAATLYYRTGVTTIVRDWIAFDTNGVPEYYPDITNYAAVSASPNISAVTVAFQARTRQVLIDPVTGRVTAP